MPPVQPKLKLILTDRFDSYKGELANPTVDHVSWDLYAPGEVEFSLPWNHVRISEIATRISDLRVVIDGKTRWIGTFRQALDRPNSSTFTCKDIRAWLGERNIRFSSLICDPMEQTDIAWNLVNYAQAPWSAADWTASGLLSTEFSDPRWLGIIKGSYFASSHNRSRRYLWQEHANILDALAEFPKLADGFDWDIVYNDTTKQREFMAYYPKRENDFNGYTVEWGKNISDFAVAEDADHQATTAISSGGTAGITKMDSIYKDYHAGVYFGDTEAVISVASLDSNTLTDRAHKEVLNRREPQITPQITSVSVPDSVIVEREVGDAVHIKIVRGRVKVNLLYRITKMTWKPATKLAELVVTNYFDRTADFVFPPGFPP